MISRRLGAGFALAVGLFAGSGPARAQVPPEAAPVLEIVAPVASPVCGNAVVVVVAAPGVISGQLGSPLPVDISPVLGPVFVVCGSVPAPGQRLKCSADDTVRSTIDTITGTAAGTALPLDTGVAGIAVAELFVVQDTLPAPANTAGLAEMAAATLTCTPVASTPEAPAEPTEEPVPTSTDDFEELFALPDLPDLESPPPIDSTVSADAQLGSSAGPELEAAIGSSGPGFAYPVVFALPLLFLLIGAYLGRMLTRSVAAPTRAQSR